MKKRTKLIVGLSLILAVVVGGATMAWFTSNTENITNLFKTGTVKVTLNDYTGTSEANPFLAISNVNPGDSYDKKVSVTSNSSMDTYVRVKLIPAWSNKLSTTNVIMNIGSDWVKAGDYYYYKSVLKSGETTSLLLNGLTFDGASTDNGYQNATFTIDVEAEAVQASHYAFRDVWQIDNNAKVPAPGVEEWTAANEEPSAAQ